MHKHSNPRAHNGERTATCEQYFLLIKIIYIKKSLTNKKIKKIWIERKESFIILKHGRCNNIIFHFANVWIISSCPCLCLFVIYAEFSC